PKNTSRRTLLKHYWLLALTSVIGSVLGVWLLFVLPTAYISLMMAAVILYYATQGLFSLHGLVRPLTVPTGKLSMAGFGLGSGLIGGATNAMSPILLMYLLSKTDDKDEIAIASNLCYLLAKVVQIALLWQEFARFDMKLWGLMGVITVFSLIGLSVGTALRPKISQQLFKRLIYIILLILGLKIAYSNLLPLFA
ncbi:MAG: sulfite exporter TauE/SafE family protein, partial [Moraxella sp.]|nr:sulfite exporter TauE/SafE family protein [Moraxella sp.]